MGRGRGGRGEGSLGLRGARGLSSVSRCSASGGPILACHLSKEGRGGPRSLSLAICHLSSPSDARPCSARVSRWPGDSLVEADPSRGHTVTAARGHLAEACLFTCLFIYSGRWAGRRGAPGLLLPAAGTELPGRPLSPGVCRPCTACRVPGQPPSPPPRSSVPPDESRGAAADGSRL